MIHVAILKLPYLRGILDGWKTIESRLYRVPQPPYRRIGVGERIFLKVSAGPWMATAVASQVDTFDGLTPPGVDALRREFGDRIGGDDEYWAWKRSSTVATLVHLADVEPLDVGPDYPRTQRAWHVLDDELSPLLEHELTAGALANRYAPAPHTHRHRCISGGEGDAPFTLHLPDSTTITTPMGRGRMLAFRGWAKLYAAHALRPGDHIRYLREAPNTYRVSFVRQRG